jgi:hypothetical protein
MSFRIDFAPQEPIQVPGSLTAQLLKLAVPDTHPDFAKHSRFMTLLCTQSNQISGKNNEASEQDIASNGPSGNDFCKQCNNLSTTHVLAGMQPIVRGFLSDFEASARNGCKICLLLLATGFPLQGARETKGIY